VRDEQPTAQFIENLRRKLFESRRRSDHRRIDPGQPGDEGRNFRFRIDQHAPFARTVFVQLDNPDLDNPIVSEIGAGGFEIDENDRFERRCGAHRQKRSENARLARLEWAPAILPGNFLIRIICIM